MEGIYNANDEFPFSNLVLLKPISISGGNYFIKFRINESPLYIQTPKCNTKNGILKAGKKYFSDLMFTNEHETFIQWIEKLEDYCQKYIYDNRTTWFDTELEMHDIENSFSSCFKLYKSGKYYIVRCNVPTQLGMCSLKIYNENEELIDHSEMNDKNDIITILEIQGIKCSARSFQIEIEIKQMLVLRQTNLFEKCILSSGNKYQQSALTEDSSSERNNELSGDNKDLGKQNHIIENQLELSSNPNIGIARTQPVGTTGSVRDLSGYGLSSKGKGTIINTNRDTTDGFIEPHHDNHSQINDSINNNKNTVSNNTIPDLSSDYKSRTSITSRPTNARNENWSSPTVGTGAGVIAIPPPIEPSISLDDIARTQEVGTTGSVRDLSGDGLSSKDKEELDEDDNESDELKEIEFTLDEIPENDQIQIKTRNDVYYKMYQDAKQKAKMAKALALSSYLEAQRIKNTYMLEDLDDSDSDLEEDIFN